MKVLNLIPIFILLFIFSCKESDKERITRLMVQWQGKEVQFPSKMMFTKFASDTVDYQIPESDYKIVVIILPKTWTTCEVE